MTDKQWKPKNFAGRAEAGATPQAEPRKHNGHARPEDFLLPEFEEHTLPSGLRVKLRVPNDLEFSLLLGTLPGSVAAAMEGRTGEALNPEQVVEWAWKKLSALIVEPKFSPEPGPGEFHPRQLRREDREWLMNYYDAYAHGGGRADLERFRGGEPGADAGDGGSGERVQAESVELPESAERKVGV